MLAHATSRLLGGARLPVVRSSKPAVVTGRACCGSSHPRAPDPRPTGRTAVRSVSVCASKFAGRPGRDYKVIGKGGLVRIVRLPNDLTDRLEHHRRPEPARVTDHGGTTPPATTSAAAAAKRQLQCGIEEGARVEYRAARLSPRLRPRAHAGLHRDLLRRDALETVSTGCRSGSPCPRLTLRSFVSGGHNPSPLTCTAAWFPRRSSAQQGTSQRSRHLGAGFHASARP